MIKETLLVSTFGLLGLVTVACGSQKKDQTAEAVSETAWCLDGFERPTGVNPVIKPDRTSSSVSNPLRSPPPDEAPCGSIAYIARHTYHPRS